MTFEGLPVLRGIGGHCVQTLGKCNTDVTVQGITESIEVLVVNDAALKYPVLLGHSFTEKPGLVIIKTTDQIVFEKVTIKKIFLMAQDNVTMDPGQIVAVPVESRTSFTGQVYVNGTIRGTIGNEHYLLPGEYKLTNGAGRLLVQF